MKFCQVKRILSRLSILIVTLTALALTACGGSSSNKNEAGHNNQPKPNAPSTSDVPAANFVCPTSQDLKNNLFPFPYATPKDDGYLAYEMWPSTNGILVYLVGLKLSTVHDEETAKKEANSFWDNNKADLNKEPTIIRRANHLNQDTQFCVYYGDMSDKSKPLLFITAFDPSQKANNFNQ